MFHNRVKAATSLATDLVDAFNKEFNLQADEMRKTLSEKGVKKEDIEKFIEKARKRAEAEALAKFEAQLNLKAQESAKITNGQASVNPKKNL